MKKKILITTTFAHTHGRSAPLDIDTILLSPFSFLVLYGFGIDACTSIFSTLITASTKKVKDREREKKSSTQTQRVVDAVDPRGKQTSDPTPFFRECIHDTIAPLLVSLLCLIMQRYLKDDHI